VLTTRLAIVVEIANFGRERRANGPPRPTPNECPYGTFVLSTDEIQRGITVGHVSRDLDQGAQVTRGRSAGASDLRSGSPLRVRGQSLVEFALVMPLLLVLMGGAVQLGVIFAAKNSLTQVARDTARWAAAQTIDPCSSAATPAPVVPQPMTQANAIASDSSLIGYSTGMWNAGNFTVYADSTSTTPLPATPPNGEGVEVVWSYAAGTCPPSDNSTAAFVTVRLTHTIPVLLAGLQYLPGLGTCDASGCHIAISATSMFRMEPPPE
jgi:hypothetical protein